jgi:hypothetical protein
MKLIIDRGKWRNGGRGYNHKYGITKLLNKEGFMCCLGFFCVQIDNMKLNEILDIPNPVGLDSNLVGYDGLTKPWAHSAIQINDDDSLPQEIREKRIHEIFKDYGYDVKFTGEYPE